MKQRLFLVIAVVSFVALMSSCRGFKTAPPCPAYSMVELPIDLGVLPR